MAGWYGTLAFPLTDPAAAEPQEPDAQAQTQPRDPRPEAARPATAREQELLAATTAAPGNVKQWLELAKLQEDRGAVAEAEATLEAAFSATSGSREVLMSQARFFARNGQFDKSMTLLENAAAQNPMDPTGYQLVATYYWEKAQKDQTLTPADKLMYIDKGIAATDSALAQNPDYIEALTYKNILLRMKGNAETDQARRAALLAEADVLRNRAMELSKLRGTLRAASGVPAGAPPPPPPPPPPSEHNQIDGQEALRVGGEIKTPVKLHDVRPVYPPDAHAAGISGLVIIEVAIDTQGTVRSTFVKRSVPALDQAALDAVRQWRFAPTFHEGVAVPVLMTVTVNFTIQ
jgi:TonB family protein